MTARRQARAKPSLVTSGEPGSLPAAFRVGRCIDVWAAEIPNNLKGRSIRAIGLANKRFGVARRAYLAAAGVSERDGWQVIPAGAAWALTGSEQDEDRLGRAGCTLDDIRPLIEQADDLFADSFDTGSRR